MTAMSERARNWVGALNTDPAGAVSASIGAVLSELLLTDEAAAERLGRLRGRVIAIGIRDTSHEVFMSLEPAGVRVLPDGDAVPDVRVTGSTADFIAYARASRRGDSIGAGRIEISGDLQTAQDVQALLSELSVDFDALLSRYVGGVAAHQLGRLIRALGSQGRTVAQRLEEDFAEYVHAESGILPTRRETEQLARAALILANDVDRLEARLARLDKGRAR